MGDAAITPAVDIELQGFELHHPGAGLINKAQIYFYSNTFN
jgi:hypothetical protein